MSTSKSKWQGLERFAALMINGQRVYAQSAKFLKAAPIAAIANGDVISPFLLGECKVRDFALGTKLRKDNPRKPSEYFRVDCKWWDQIAREAKEVERLPFLIVNRKFTGPQESFIVLNVDTFVKILRMAGIVDHDGVDAVMKAWSNKDDREREECD